MPPCMARQVIGLLLACALLAHGQVAYAPAVPIHQICGHCCQEGSYCEATSRDTTLAKAAGGLSAGHMIPGGTAMTCYLRDRDQAGAVDGGLCIPSGVPDITSFCASLSGSPSSLVVPTTYEAGLEEQQHACGPCCDGSSVCGLGLKCSRVEGGEVKGGVCVPEAEDGPGFCQGLSLSKETLSCERCDAYTASARMLLSGNAHPASYRRSLAQSFGGGGGGSTSSSGGSSGSSGGASSIRDSSGGSTNTRSTNTGDSSTTQSSSSNSGSTTASDTQSTAAETQPQVSSSSTDTSAPEQTPTPVATQAPIETAAPVATPSPTTPAQTTAPVATPSPTTPAQTAAPFATPSPTRSAQTTFSNAASGNVVQGPPSPTTQADQGANQRVASSNAQQATTPPGQNLWQSNNQPPIQNPFQNNNWPPVQNPWQGNNQPPFQNPFQNNNWPPFQNPFQNGNRFPPWGGGGKSPPGYPPSPNAPGPRLG